MSLKIHIANSKSDKTELFKSVNDIGLSLQEGGRVINLCDKVSKSQAMKNAVSYTHLTLPTNREV